MGGKSKAKLNKETVLAASSYVCFVIPLLTKYRNDKLVRYHIKQGVGFFIANMFLRGLVMSVAGPPYTIFGGILSELLLQPVYLVLIIFFVLGVINSLRGNMKPLPLIGKYADRIF